jgi:hypothetical protein
MKALALLVASLALTACGHSDSAAQKAQEDAEWKASVAKAEAERQDREKQLNAATMNEHERQEAAEAAAERDRIQGQQSSAQTSLTEKLKASMFDPDAAIVRNERLSGDGRSLCGEVNGKDKLGAYTGFKKFVVYNGLAAIEDTDTSLYLSVAPLVDCHL